MLESHDLIPSYAFQYFQYYLVDKIMYLHRAHKNKSMPYGTAIRWGIDFPIKIHIFCYFSRHSRYSCNFLVLSLRDILSRPFGWSQLRIRRHFGYHGDSKTRRGIHFMLELYYKKRKNSIDPLRVLEFLYYKVPT